MELRERIKHFPHKSGVYIMKDRAERIIYIGKAKDLNKRVASYFQKKPSERKTAALVSQVESVETILTDNEIEALILESNLIKTHRPRFNIELKDNQKYPYIKITSERIPRITKTRIKKDDGALYFGPYPNVKYINRTIKTITDIFPIRRCKYSSDGKKPSTPCMNFYLGKCSCPLLIDGGTEEYQKLVQQVVLFLKGQNRTLLLSLKSEMENEAKNRRFEKAIQLRERYVAVKNVLSDQKINTSTEDDEDVFGIAQSGDYFNVTLLIKRDGKLIGKTDFSVQDQSTREDVLGEFLDLYYGESADPPRTVILPFVVEEMGTLKRYLTHKSGRNVAVIVPKKGMKKRLVDLAVKNAHEKLKEDLYQYTPQNALCALRDVLGLESAPSVIEAFDIATILGNFSAASMVRFRNGVPDKSGYRRFKIRYVSEQNDVAMMKEAVARRYQRLLNESKPLPDLILVDGGKPQLNAAFQVLDALNISRVPVIGLAKKEEEIFTRGRKYPILLERRSDALRLLMAIRNEAHRFANAYHVSMRSKNAVVSRLTKIPGVGDALVRRILASELPLGERVTVDQLKKIEGIGEKKAKEIFEVLKKKDETPKRRFIK
jgi:excinuclease ABC subunit C